jgi:aromatic-L-amino-acid decarboxylase
MHAMTSSSDVNAMLDRAAQLTAEHIERRRADPVVPKFDRAELTQRIAQFDFSRPISADTAAGELFALLRETGVRTDHPRYYGFFNPPALIPGIIGDIVADAVNPQLAVWSHAPAAAEIERHLVNFIGQRIWDQREIAGSFTSGGSEANHTALLCAMARRYPEWNTAGVRSLTRRPAIYVSAESHLAWIKIARAAGLGSEAVQLVSTSDGLRLQGEVLRNAIAAQPDLDPVLIVATAGTTAHGAIDDMSRLAAVAAEHDAHFHVDAAWAGGALLSPDHRHVLSGIEQADSVTIDPHKWLAVPMGAGMYFARDWTALETAFGVSTGYMPSASREDRDAYIHSLQWSRRFNGAKLFVALATLGKDGYASMISRQFALGERLRNALPNAGFRIVNHTPLPLVCFVPESACATAVEDIHRRVLETGEAWLSTVKLRSEDCIRACITSFETTEADVDALVDLLAVARIS